MKKKTSVVIFETEMECSSALKKRASRHFIACKATGVSGGSIKAVCEAFKCSPNTIAKTIRELSNKLTLLTAGSEYPWRREKENRETSRDCDCFQRHRIQAYGGASAGQGRLIGRP